MNNDLHDGSYHVMIQCQPLNASSFESDVLHGSAGDDNNNNHRVGD